MKQKNYNFDEERAILIGMIVDKTALGRIVPQWKPPMFKNSYSNKIADWCIKYYKKYEKAPGKNIQSIFESWSADSKNKTKIELISQFLESLSNQYRKLKKDSNSEYIVDLAGKYFNRVSLEHLSESIQANIDNGKSDKALQKVKNYKQVELGVGKGIDVFRDTQAIRECLEENHEPLIKYKGGLGKFFGDRLERDGFVVFMGPEKRGKTFWLLDAAFRGVLQRRKVAFFEVGDLSKNQIMRRFMIRVSKHPLYPCKVKKPILIEEHKKTARVAHDIKVFTKKLTWRKAYRACKKIKNRLRLSVHFNDTLSVDGIRNILETWEREDEWIPDIIIIDYADILNMDLYGYGEDERSRTNKTWQQLRKLSQERHCLVLTATQSNAASYDAKTIDQKHFSSDKRKHAHVTGMVGLNQTKKEKELGIMRLNWVELREGNYSSRQCCYVATCFELANMAVKSCF